MIVKSVTSFHAPPVATCTIRFCWMPLSSVNVALRRTEPDRKRSNSPFRFILGLPLHQVV
jgi:hypothetical protein